MALDRKKIRIVNPSDRRFQLETRAVRGFPKDPRLSIQVLEKERLDLMQLIESTSDVSIIPGVVLREIFLEFADVLSAQDMEFARKHIHQLERSVGRDRLTGVWNKRIFERDLEHVFLQENRDTEHHIEKEKYTMCIIDIDFFKRINTVGGLPVGDIALQELTIILGRIFKRGSDRIYRIGGEEFVVAVGNTPLAEVRRLMEHARLTVQKELLQRMLLRLEEGPIKEKVRQLGDITVSIGIAEKGEQHTVPKMLYTDADRSLYAAKKGLRTGGVGRNQVQLYGEDLSTLTPSVLEVAPKEKLVPVSISESSGFVMSTQTDAEIERKYVSEIKDVPHPIGAPLFHVDPVMGVKALALKIAQANMARVEQFNSLQSIESALQFIEQTAQFDSLTQLPNLSAYRAECMRVWSEMHRQGRPHGYAIFDVDHFKPINDTFGHPVGDLALRAFGRVLKKRVRKNEMVARIGGEEFVSIFQVDSEEGFKKALERLRHDIEEQVMKECQKLAREEGIDIAWDREAFTISLGGCFLSPQSAQKNGRQVFLIPSETAVRTQAAQTLLLAKESAAADLPEGSTNRTGPVGRNRWVISTLNRES